MNSFAFVPDGISIDVLWWNVEQGTSLGEHILDWPFEVTSVGGQWKESVRVGHLLACIP